MSAEECPICRKRYGGTVIPHLMICCRSHLCFDCAEGNRNARISELEGNRKKIKCMFCNNLYHSVKETPWILDCRSIELTGLVVDLSAMNASRAAMQQQTCTTSRGRNLNSQINNESIAVQREEIDGGGDDVSLLQGSVDQRPRRSHRRRSNDRNEEQEKEAVSAMQGKEDQQFLVVRTSTRRRSPVHNQGEQSFPTPQRKGASKRKRDSSSEEDRPRKKVTKKKYRECSADGCTNHSQKGGVCVRHGAKVRQCSTDGCTNIVVKGGVCIRHGAKRKRCSKNGCSNQAQKGGLCIKHGATWTKKKCSSERCTNYAIRGGVCKRHGAYRNTHDGSTAFGSEFEKTTATQILPNQRASSRGAIRGQEGRSVPGEVAILCQEIVEA